jgi:hypothetical protein
LDQLLGRIVDNVALVADVETPRGSEVAANLREELFSKTLVFGLINCLLLQIPDETLAHERHNFLLSLHFLLLCLGFQAGLPREQQNLWLDLDDVRHFDSYLFGVEDRVEHLDIDFDLRKNNLSEFHLADLQPQLALKVPMAEDILRVRVYLVNAEFVLVLAHFVKSVGHYFGFLGVLDDGVPVVVGIEKVPTVQLLVHLVRADGKETSAAEIIHSHQFADFRRKGVTEPLHCLALKVDEPELFRFLQLHYDSSIIRHDHLGHMFSKIVLEHQLPILTVMPENASFFFLVKDENNGIVEGRPEMPNVRYSIAGEIVKATLSDHCWGEWMYSKSNKMES